MYRSGGLEAAKLTIATTWLVTTSFAAVLALVCFDCPVSLASDVDNQIEAAIKSAKVLPKDMTFTVSFDPQTQEVSVSTYVNAASKDQTRDCKIDAILIARESMRTAHRAVRVRVRFFYENVKAYQEVVVTKPEIAAFAQGSVDQKDLLDSLEITSHNAVNSSSSAQRAILPRGELLQFRDNGIVFSYPRAWGIKPMNNQYGDFVELIAQRKSWCSIMFRLQKDNSYEQTALNEDKYFWSSHQRTIVGKKPIIFGASKNIQGLIVDIKDDSNPSDLTRWERHVYFGPGGKVYSVSVRFCKDDCLSVEEDLNTILSSLVFD